MKSRILLGAFMALLVAGCTTASGPTYNLDTVTLVTGEKVYRAQCQGLFESSRSCVNVAQKICKDKPVRYIQAISPGDDTPGVQNDTREIMFKCDAEVVKPAPAPVPVPVPVPPPVRKLALRGDANFATNSAALTPVATGTLDKFIADSREMNISLVSISGHTDSTGSVALNTRLSQARAESVATYLRSHGLKSERYEVQGFGSTRPIDTNATAAGRAANRRVEIEVTGE